MNQPCRDAERVAVRILHAVWQEEVERLNACSPARIAAERERHTLQHDGVARSQLQRCTSETTDGTDLRGALKVYVPITDQAPSTRPFGMVFALTHTGRGGVFLDFVAFGERHPQRPTTRSVYERAHKRLHGRYPNQ